MRDSDATADDAAPHLSDLFVAPSGAPELTVVVPCYNERQNVGPMAALLDRALVGLAWEVVFVDDDSPDGTADAARTLGRADARIRCLRRVGRRGLSSAVIEGALSSSADFVVCIDGDLQHDETRIPDMLHLLRRDDCDLVVGSRHAPGGDDGGLASASRRRLSRFGIGLARAILPVPLDDPMSGFFAIRRPLFERLAPRLTGQGFKILLDLVLASGTPLRVREVAYVFRDRAAGASKLDALVLAQFAGLLIDKALGGRLPLRFVSFACVGLVGVLVDLGVLGAAHRAGLGFTAAQTVATLVAMVANFQLNNSLTYRDQRLRGRHLWQGLLLFVLVCGLGAAANVSIAAMLYRLGYAGGLLAGAAGAVVSGVWNYAVSATLVWQSGRRR
jgi:dolichol-phosphate mannosyltransferase